MKKVLKFVSIGLVVIFTLLILIPVIFKDKLVEIAKTEINNQVNAKIDFGEFDLSIFTYFPNLNFEINNVTVSGVDKFEGDTLMQLKQFSVKVDVMSVMGDNIKVLGVHLIEPTIYAHIRPDTTANWDIAKESNATEQDTKDIDVNAEEQTESASEFNMALKEFSIRKANITYYDEPGDLKAELKNLDYTLSGDMGLTNVKLDMALLIESITVEMEKVKYLNKTNIEYTAGLNADLDKMKFDLLENKFRLNQLVLSLNGFLQMNDDDSYAMDLSFETNKNKFKDLLSLVPLAYTSDFADIKTSGKLKLEGFAKGTYSEKQLPTFNLNLNIDNASVQYPDLPASVNKIFVDLNIDNKDGVDDHTVINLKRFDLDLAGNSFSASYLTKTPVSDPYIDGYVKGNIDFDKLKDAIPLDSMSISGLMSMDLKMKGHLSTIEKEQYDKFDATGNISLKNFIYKASDLDYDVLIDSTAFEITPKYFTLNNFDAHVGKSDFHADGQIDNFIAYYFNNDVLKGAFNLKSNLIDANELAGDDSASESTETNIKKENTEEDVNKTSENELNEEAPMTVVELPSNVDFELNTKLNKILYDTYEIENFEGKVILKEAVANLQNVQMNIIDGTLGLNGTYDVRDINAPKIKFDFKMLNFDLKKTFETFNTVEKLAPIAENCNGLFSMNLNLDATLDKQMEPIQESMNGSGGFKSKSIVIGGSESMEKLAGLLKNEKYKEAKLENIDAKFTIEDGNIIILPTPVKWNDSKATFGGKQGVDQSIDYLLNVEIPRSDLGEANALMENLMAQNNYTKDVDLGKTINADIFITGTLEKPHFSIGVKDLVNNVVDQVKDQIKEKVEELIDNTKEEAIAEAKKQAEALMVEAEKQSKVLIAESEKQAVEIRKAGKNGAKQATAEANKQIDDLMKEAGNNPIAKMAAKEAGKKLKSEAAIEAKKIESEANKRADQLVSETKKQTSNIKNKAKEEGDKLIMKAEKL